jgi:Zn-dependent metalloprotease
VRAVRLRAGVAYCAASIAAAIAAIGISLLALSALVLGLGASGVGGLVMSGQPLHVAVDDGAVAFYLTQLVSVSFFHHTAGLSLAVLPGLALVAGAITISAMVMVRLIAGSVRRRMLVTLLMAIAYALLAGFGARFLPLRLSGPFVGRDTPVVPVGGEAFVLPLLWGLLFAPLGGLVGVFGRRWRVEGLRLLGVWATPLNSSLRVLAPALALTSVVVLVGSAVLAARTGAAHLLFAGASFGHDAGVVGGVLIALPTLVVTMFLACFGVSFDWHVEAISHTQGSGSILGGTLPTIGESTVHQVPGLLVLLLLVGAVTVVSVGWLTARRSEGDVRVGIAGALRAGVVMTLICWLFALFGRLDAQAGGYLGAHFQVDVASLLWRVPLWCLLGSVTGASAYFVNRDQSSRRELPAALLDLVWPSRESWARTDLLDSWRSGLAARAVLSVGVLSLPAMLVGFGSAGAGATATPSPAGFSLAPISHAAELQLRAHAEPGAHIAVTVNPSTRVLSSAEVRIPLAALGVSSHDSPVAKTRAVLARYGNLFGVADHPGELGDPEVVSEPITRTEDGGMTHVFYKQIVDGVPVFGGSIGVHLSPDGMHVNLVTNAFVPEVSVADDNVAIDSARSLAIAKEALPVGKLLHEPRLEVYAGPPSHPLGASARLAWFVELTAGPLKPAREYVIDAVNGSILNVFNRAFNVVNVKIYDAEEKETLPGTFKWETEKPKSELTEVSEAATNVTNSYEFFEHEFFEPSCSGPGCNGKPAVATVDYRKTIKQAEWNTEHQEIVFGKGIQAGLDVTGHEYGGGILQHTVSPIMENEQGALMEGWADTMGKGLEAWTKRNTETNKWAEPNWEFGSTEPEGFERRNLKEPSKTKDTTELKGYDTACEDNGDIHKNSTIISHAFYLLVQKIGVQEATQIFYRMEVYFRAETFEQARKDAIEAARNREESPRESISKKAKENKVAEQTGVAFTEVGLTELPFLVPNIQLTCETGSICSGESVLAAEEPKNGTSSTLAMLTTLYRARGVLAQPSVAGHYYMPLYEANMGRITELISRDPTLDEMTVNGLKQITPALDALIEGEGQKYKLPKSVMAEIEAALKRLAQDDRMYSGGGSLAELIERELNFLRLPSYAGMTYAAGFKHLNDVVKPLTEKPPPPTTIVEDPECESRHTNEHAVFEFTAGTPGHKEPGEASPLDGSGLVCGTAVEKVGNPETATCSKESENTLNTKATLELPPGDKLRPTSELSNGSWIGTVTGRVIACAGEDSKAGLGVTGIKSKKEWTSAQCPTAATACYEGSATVEEEGHKAEGHAYAWVKEETIKERKRPVLTVGAPEVEAKGEREFKVPTGFTMFKIELCAYAGEPGTTKCGTSTSNWVHKNGEESQPGCSNEKGSYAIQVTNVAGKTTPREEYCDHWGEELHKELVDSERSITGISCVPHTTDCALTDNKGNEYYSTTVSATEASTWKSWTGPATRGEAIACPSSTLCALADGEVKSGGDMYYATSLGGTWTKAFEPSNGALSISCPTSSFCVDGQESGAIRYSTSPASTSWTELTIGSGSLNAIDCLSASFCATVNSSGDLYVANTEAKIKEATGWKSTDIDGSTALHGVACMSTTSCIAVDGAGNIIDLAINSSDEATATKHDVDASNDLTAVTCTEEATCVAVDNSGNILVSGSAGQSWSKEHALGKELTSVACPSGALCVAADKEGNVTAFTPLGVISPSDTQTVDSGNSLNAISCVPNATDCVVSDSTGKTYYSTDVSALTSATWTSWTGPTGQSPSQAIACPSSSLCVLADGAAAEGGGNLYYATSLDGAWKEAFSPIFGVESVSCASTSLCVTGDQEGFVRYSTKPASEEWVALEIGSGTMNATDCLSSSFCAVVDSKGNVHIANTEAKIKEESGWKSTDVDSTTALHGIACTSTTSCLAVDGEGHILHLTINSSGEATVSKEDLDGTNDLTAITCVGTTTCVAVDSKGNVFESTNAGASWKQAYALGTDLTSVSCSASTQCAAADTTGEVTTFRPE